METMCCTWCTSKLCCIPKKMWCRNVSNTSLHQQQSKVVGMQSERANQCTKQMSNGFWLGNPEREGSKTGRLKVSLDNQSADNWRNRTLKWRLRHGSSYLAGKERGINDSPPLYGGQPFRTTNLPMTFCYLWEPLFKLFWPQTFICSFLCLRKRLNEIWEGQISLT